MLTLQELIFALSDLPLSQLYQLERELQERIKFHESADKLKEEEWEFD